MRREQIENIYKMNGLTDYKLKNTEDLLKCHGIDYEKVEGYKQLDDLNKKIYKKFIINFFNGLGLESRADLVPKGIYFVEDIQYLAKEKPEVEYFVVIGGTIMAFNRNGRKSLLYKWEDENYKHLEAKEEEVTTYLRFEYEHKSKKEWVHVIDGGKSWY
ncbi:hypothetical protein [Caldisalinibacter kiritimatiensis]|uniref:Uncharacterized protein n=1 Tax=Caldisalinibacter kiritimatiensis TaxID=1304284 RepID=R1CGL8_9FIRM|nr:hypothetical protein [Caldisalinibacter kiritimatiensis]EOD01440.1 hypothetical protein L21TH_0487 [Caldisalinibacter kiritimatiensis]